MAKEPARVLLVLDKRARKLLGEIVTVYMREGGPAWECAPEWGKGYASAEVAAIAAEIEAALEAPIHDR